MAAPSLTLSNPGVINGDSGTWDKDNALFLKFFLRGPDQFKRACIFEDLVQTRTIQNGRSAQFPVTGRFKAAYHTPGSMIVGQGDMAQNEVVIRIDDYLIADASLYSLQEAKAHYDIRSIYSTELGQALAREHDKRLARTIALGARTSTADLKANTPAGLSLMIRSVPARLSTSTKQPLLLTISSPVCLLQLKPLIPRTSAKKDVCSSAPLSPSIR